MRVVDGEAQAAIHTDFFAWAERQRAADVAIDLGGDAAADGAEDDPAEATGLAAVKTRPPRRRKG